MVIEMTVNEIEKRLQEIATRIHPRLIVTVETVPRLLDQEFKNSKIELFDSRLRVHFKFKNTGKIYTTIVNYHLINKLRTEDELKGEMYFHRIIREGFFKLLWRK